MLLGMALLLRLPVAGSIRVGLAAIWLLSSIWEIGRISRGARRIKIIRLTAGEAMIVNRQGRQEAVEIMSGSVVLPGFAWLRLKCPDGLIHAELLRGDPVSCQHWRHLQVLWRTRAGCFGRATEADTISTPKRGSHF